MSSFFSIISRLSGAVRSVMALGMLLVVFTKVDAQPRKIDSLLTILHKNTGRDTTTVNRLTQLADAYALTDNDKALDYATQSITLAEQLGFKQGLAKAWFAKGYAYSCKSQFRQVIYCNEMARKLYLQLKDNKNVVICQLEIGSAYYSLSDFSTGLSYALSGMKMAERINNKELMLQAYNRLTIDLTMLADHTRALEMGLRALNLAEQMHNDVMNVKLLGNIGVIYYYMKQYDNSLNYTFKCLQLARKLHNDIVVPIALNNIGGDYLEMKDYPNAIKYNAEAYLLNKKMQQDKGMGNNLMDIGVAYSYLNQPDSALRYLDRSAAIYERVGATNNLAQALGHLSKIYMEADARVLKRNGIDPAKRYRLALASQQKAVDLAHKSKQLTNEADQLLKLSRVYEKIDRPAAAFDSYKKYSALKDSLFNDNKKLEIARLEMSYQFAKREADIRADNTKKAALAAEQLRRERTTRTTMLGGAALAMLLAVAGFIFYRRRNVLKAARTEAELKAEIAETKLKALRVQLNPHFLFNSLNSISDYIDRNEKHVADIYITKFARLMRMILENSEQNEISLADDLKALELYIQLEAMRLDNKFTYQIIIDDDIDIDDTLVPPMLLQPFVENSIWHGISTLKVPGKISIAIKREGDTISCTVTDNGIGRQRASIHNPGQQAVASKKSFGMRVIRDRLSILSLNGEKEAGLQVDDLENGTSVTVKLPFTSALA